jgi:hypothetical protein
MQDKPWNDKAFEDESWRRMRALLDRKLPTGVILWRRRLLRWAAAAALPLLAGGMWYLTRSAPVVETPAAALAEEVSPSRQSPARAEPAPKTLEIPGAGARESTRKARSFSFPSQPGEKPADIEPGERLPPSIAESPLDPPSIVELFPAKSGEEPVVEAIDKAPGRLAPSLETETLASPIAESQAPGSVAPQAPNQSELEQAVAALLAQLESEETVVSPDENAARANWGLNAAGLAETSARGQGYALGLGGAIPLGQSRWGLRADLRYMYRSTQFLPRPGGAVANALARSETTKPSGSFDPSLPFDQNQGAALSALNAGLHGLSLPLTLEYRLSPKFSLGLGPQLFYQAAARGARREDASPVSISPAFGQFASNTQRLIAVSAGETYDPSLFNRFDAGLAGNIGYRPAERLGLRLQYSFGALNNLNSSDYQSFNRFVEVGLTYYLRPSSSSMR